MEFVKVVDNLFSQKECEQIIKKFTDSSLVKADRHGADYKRGVVYDANLRDILQSRLGHNIPNRQDVIGLSDRFRFSEYETGGEFSIHQDGIYQDPRNGHRSAFTLSLYLNEDFTGGETSFMNAKNLEEAMKVNKNSVEPKTGRGILFPREVYHMGNKVLKGKKYLLRTDVMVTGFF